jgi:hypothetical protein
MLGCVSRTFIVEFSIADFASALTRTDAVTVNGEGGLILVWKDAYSGCDDCNKNAPVSYCGLPEIG